MPAEIPDFTHMAQVVVDWVDPTLAILETDSYARVVLKVTEQLRHVWVARGAADIAKLEWAFDPAVSNGQPSMKLLDQVLRTLDR